MLFHHKQMIISMNNIIGSLLLSVIFFNNLIAVLSNSDETNVNTVKTKQLKYVADLQNEYFNVKRELWKEIDDKVNKAKVDESEKNVLVTEIIENHKQFFFDETREATSYWRSFLLMSIENLKGNLTVLNDTLEDGLLYVYDDSPTNRNIYQAAKISQWAENAIGLRANIDALFDITFHADHVLQHIRTEAKCCTKYVKYVISEVQLVREYYAQVAKALLRGHAMTQLTYMLLTLSNERETYQQDADLYGNFFKEKYLRFINAIEQMLSAASHDLWKCNPNPYLDDRNYYTSITNFMQGYVDNEINLNADGSCTNTCKDYSQSRNYRCNDGTLCAHKNFEKTACKGEVVNCSVIESDGTACLVADELENRRYNFIKFQNGTTNGHNVLCFKAEKIEIQTWSRWLVNECSNCFCYCNEPGPKSDRYFSLREVVSDINSNKVITGVSLQKKNRVIQFVISERNLYPNAQVDATPRRPDYWKSDTFEFLNGSASKEGIDYHTLTWEHRSINLDTIKLPADQVVTGVRFRLLEGKLILEVRATTFNYHSGRLEKLEESEWLNNLNEEYKKTKIVIEEPDSPTRTTNIQERIDSENKFVEFQPSDIKKDLAQVTVPYIETVYLEATEPRPLSGLGLYYKGEYGFGGFVALKLRAYDFGPTVKPTS